MSDDLFTEYVRVTSNRFVRLTEENALAVAREINGEVSFTGNGLVVSKGAYRKDFGVWIDESGSTSAGDGEHPSGYEPAPGRTALTVESPIENFDTYEVKGAKDQVTEILAQEYEVDSREVADKIVVALIRMGWRPTAGHDPEPPVESWKPPLRIMKDQPQA